MKIGLFTTYRGIYHVNQAIKACEELGVLCEVVDVTSANWLQNVLNSDCDGFFCLSTNLSQELKTIQDERYYFISQVMHKPIYPDFTGLYIHESKRNMATWLELNGLPHARTKVFTDRAEALAYLDECTYPIVTKANVGAGASKVIIIKDKTQAKRMAKKCLITTHNRFLHPGFAYRAMYRHKFWPLLKNTRDRQNDYFLVQDFVKDVMHEWRILKIGDSYFGHQKLLKGDFASGSGLVGWVAPPKELLDMVRELCEKGGFLCMDVDIFETKDGQYSINELQASFGSYLDYQMCIDGHHGRYVYRGGEYVFEEGDFNVYGSTKIKLEHFIHILSHQ